MEDIYIWAMRIAEVAVPDEIDLARPMTQAYLTGGKYREELFIQTKSGMPGAFSPDTISAVFPWILQSITIAAPLLYGVLSSQVVNHFLTAVKDYLDIRERFKQTPKDNELVDNSYAPLKNVITTISHGLREAGIEPDTADLITYRVLCSMLEKPDEATHFVHTITGDIS